jgi:DNA topoisomerase-1
MDQIQLKQENRQKVLSDTIEILRTVTESFKQNQLEIGAQLGQKIRQTRLNEQTLGKCPKCQTGKLVIIRSKKSDKRFVGCTNFFEDKCSTSFPLPQTGIIKPLATPCRTCGYPIIKILIKTKQPWKLCVNINCSSKERRNNEM